MVWFYHLFLIQSGSGVNQILMKHWKQVLENWLTVAPSSSWRSSCVAPSSSWRSPIGVPQPRCWSSQDVLEQFRLFQHPCQSCGSVWQRFRPYSLSKSKRKFQNEGELKIYDQQLLFIISKFVWPRVHCHWNVIDFLCAIYTNRARDPRPIRSAGHQHSARSWDHHHWRTRAAYRVCQPFFSSWQCHTNKRFFWSDYHIRIIFHWNFHFEFK